MIASKNSDTRVINSPNGINTLDLAIPSYEDIAIPVLI